MKDKFQSMKNKRKGLLIFIVLLLLVSTMFTFINNSRTVKISKEQGKVDNKVATKLIDAIKPSDYGKSINYSVTINGTTLDDWKVLYKDSSHVYIILASAFLPEGLVPSASGLVTGDGSVSSKTSVWSATNRDRLLAGLTTESYWADFAKGVSGATATGAATGEMLLNSYNAKYNTSKTLSSDTVFYQSDGSTLDPLYVPKSFSGSYGYWLATPYSGNTNNTWFVYYKRSIGK